jgi:hypothetical protein
MTHRHEWFVCSMKSGKIFASCKHCELILVDYRIDRRLNAVEALSAEDARRTASDIWQQDYAQIAEEWRDKDAEKRYNAMLDYARILEGDDD